MLEFNTKAIGMALPFAYTPENASFFSIAYLGHNDVSSRSVNGTVFPGRANFSGEKNRAKGLLEIAPLQISRTHRCRVTNSFSHLGLLVPNTMETQSRFREVGVSVLMEGANCRPWRASRPIAMAWE